MLCKRCLKQLKVASLKASTKTTAKPLRTPSEKNRAHLGLAENQLYSSVSQLGGLEILHYGVELGRRRKAGGTRRSSSWQSDEEVVFGNLKGQNKTTMTSTNMFQGLDTGSKPSSRVLQPPGGGSSNLFGGYEEDAAASRRPNKMASKVFSPPEEPQNAPRRSNPPGGKSSGIFGEPEPPAQPQRPVPPGGPTNNIFGPADIAPVQSPSRSHPNKPKDNLSVGPEPESPAPEAKVSQPEVKEETAPPAPAPAKEEPPAAAAVSAPSEPECSPSSLADETSLKNHEPHLGPRPRSHNRVLNPPGGKSSVVFY